MDVENTKRPHWLGELITYKDKLVALGDYYNRSVEVLENGMWDENQIKPIGNKEVELYGFTSIVIEEKIYVFGKNKLFQIT